MELRIYGGANGLNEKHERLRGYHQNGETKRYLDSTASGTDMFVHVVQVHSMDDAPQIEIYSF